MKKINSMSLLQAEKEKGDAAARSFGRKDPE